MPSKKNELKIPKFLQNADSLRKKKEAQSIAMGKVKAKKAANAASKRMTAQAKSYPPAKKAASSYALGLTKSAKNKLEKKKRNA
jgi:hypothetical protein